jgi:hypothetical protein
VKEKPHSLQTCLNPPWPFAQKRFSGKTRGEALARDCLSNQWRETKLSSTADSTVGRSSAHSREMTPMTSTSTRNSGLARDLT